MNKVLILGGYGNFGKRIARQLAERGVQVIIAGRDRTKAAAVAKELPAGTAENTEIDITAGFPQKLRELKPVVVINTIGPYQTSDYSVARDCIASGIHYIDLADGRDFVKGFSALNERAVRNNVAAITGASTVPGLSSAVVEHYLHEFSEIESLRFGITPGQKAERGLATTEGILGYVGKKLKPCAGYEERYGWQDLYIQNFPEIGRRLMANCDIPDLDLLPEKYGIKSIQFSAGMENPFVHMGIWLLSWVVRIGVPIDLAKYSPFLLRASNWFDFIGTADGGMHMIIEGKDKSGVPISKRWFIIAKDGDGPYIPTIPAVILAERIVRGSSLACGAYPCVGLISLQQYISELMPYKVSTHEQVSKQLQKSW